MTKPNVYIKNFGCQMNVRDSEFVTGLLIDSGFKLTESMAAADVVLFNSCSVRKHAEDRLFSNIAQLKGLKKKRPSLVIGLIGCTAQNYRERILRRSPLVDIVCGPGNEPDLPKILKDVIKNKCPVVAADKVNEKRPELFPEYRGQKFRALVSIGEGCNNFCSYCIVPYVRGRERYRRAVDIIREVKDLAARGFKEITLLGQNVNSYGRRFTPHASRTTGFARLLERLNAIDGIERIRFMTSHPKDASIDLFEAMAGLDKVCEHLHLPLQSGSDRMLRLMNRRYTQKKYLKLVDAYRKIVPGGSITTDIIVGFPSEKTRDFDQTLKVVKRVGFDSAFTFKYSPRPPSRSARLEDDVEKEEKEDRLKRLMELQAAISQVKNRELTGESVEVLVDAEGAEDGHHMTGRTRTNKIVVFKAARLLVGKLTDVRIESATAYALKGRRA